jgi:AcrR family transcriptional regulator/DNA-binding MarR family transcriptional regulator
MSAESSGELRMSVKGVRGGAMYAGDLQRGRLLTATFSLVGEGGYEGVSARSVAERAGVSNRTFYECFSDREDCFLAAFNYAVEGLEFEVRRGWESQLGWTARTRAALTALLQTLDGEPAVARLVFVEALSAGPRVLARRARVLERLAEVVDQGRENARAPRSLPPLVAEGVVGATFGVIHARLLELRSAPLIGLLGQLMATIVLPYRGSTAAAKELERPTPRSPVRAARRDGSGLSRRPLSVASPVDYRLTVRTQMALAAVGGRPGLNNLEVSEIIGLADQGQISRMMKRLQTQGLVENAQGHTNRQVKAWRLTADGEAVIAAHRPLKRAQRKAGRGGKLATTRSAAGRRGKSVGQASRGFDSVGSSERDTRGRRPFRLTALTREVLGAVASLGGQGLNPSNRVIADLAGVKDDGQISKLLHRLEGHGLLQNSGGMAGGIANAWQLTPRGEEILRASRFMNERAAR